MQLPLFIPALLLLLFSDALHANHGASEETYQEQLVIRSLNGGQISAFFQFRTFIPTSLDVPYGVKAGQHNDIFPLSLLRLFYHQEVQELHLSLTKGKWKYGIWGLPNRDVPPNAHLSVWFNSYINAPENWKKLTSFLSGQFCASVDLIKPTVTIRPKIAFRPFLHQANQANVSTAQEYGYLAALPQEAICTENLTPWSKLLPCQSKKGLGNLLVATNIFNSQFISLSLDFKFSCSDIINCASTPGIELTQNLLVVFNAPLILDGRFSWTLNSLFNSPLQNYCPLSSSSHVYLEATHLASINGSKLSVEPTRYVRFTNAQENLVITAVPDTQIEGDSENVLFADYELKQVFDKLARPATSTNGKQVLNLGIQYPNGHKGNLPAGASFATVHVRRHARGFGVYSGGLSVTITNSLPSDISAIYLDMIPWFFRMYLHTLVIEATPLDNINGPSRRIQPRWLHYEPAENRVKPHHLELLLVLPARSRVEIRFEYENQFLRWTEFPPDANHGLYINPASVTFFMVNQTTNFERFLPQFFDLLNSKGATASVTAEERLRLLEQYQPLRLYTEPILISMPTPDFSMPYNVVCLVSTVLSIAFGPIFNLATRQTRLIRKLLAETKKADNDTDSAEEDSKTKKTKVCHVM